MPFEILGISGSVRWPSRTTALVRSVTDRVAALTNGRSDLVEIAEAAPHLFAALSRDRLDDDGRRIVDRVENADALIVGTPVYRASYTGALKHLFDLVDHRALAGKPVILAATGGSPLHGLVTEHQLRPLLSFFGAHTLPTTLYAVESDFRDFRLTDPAIAARIERAAREAAEHLAARAIPSRLSVPAAAIGR